MNTHLIGAAAIGFAAGAYGFCKIGPQVGFAALVAGGFGALAPDLDSDTGRPLRALFNTAAIAVPMVLLWKARDATIDGCVLLTALFAVSLIVRFPLMWFFKMATVHRGILHSIPAALVFGAAAGLLTMGKDFNVAGQRFISMVAATGYLAHLLLDEISSVDISGVRMRTKRSFGTALKLTGGSSTVTVIAYVVLAAAVWRVRSVIAP